MQNLIGRFAPTTLTLALALSAGAAMAAPIPAGWTQQGNAGSSAVADGNIGLAPGDKGYVWVSTRNGLTGVGSLAGVGGAGSPTNGSTATSGVFAAKAGDTLSFFFNYLTSDGAGFADYAWAQLLDASNAATLLFTARTTPNGNTVPGFSMPAPVVSLNPSSVTIKTGTSFSGIGASSGQCWNINGCGHTGWVQANFTVATAGNYSLRAGVTNWNDTAFDSALAIANVTIGGVDIDNPNAVPEPGALALAGLGLLGVAFMRRRKAA